MELRALNDQNFALFDAKLEQRVAELHARFTELNARFEQRLAEQTAMLERRLGDQTRWFFVAWASLLLPIIGLWFRH